MLESIVYFLIFLNPIALFIYLLPLEKELGLKSSNQIIIRASAISFVIYSLFAVFGELIFSEILNINFESFRVFGGLVLITFSLIFIIQGKKSMITTRGELSQIAAEVALPFIVGAGTIALSILMGNRLGAVGAVFAILVGMVINSAIIMAMGVIRWGMSKRMQIVFDKNAEIFLRVNGFLVGAIGVDLMVTGIKNLF